MSTPIVLLAKDGNLGIVTGSQALNASSTQTAWFIDPVSGNNANDGLTSGTAIQTDAERQRRVGLIWNIVADTTVTYLNNVPATDPCVFNFTLGTNGVLRIKGTPATNYSGTFSAVTDMNRATQTASAVTDVTMGAGRTGQRVRATSGAAINSIAWLDRDFGAGVYRTSPWGIANLAASPIPGNPTATNVDATNTFVVETLTTIGYLSINNLSAQYGGALSVNGSQIVVSDLSLTQSDVVFSMQPVGSVTNAPFVYGCRVHPPANAAMAQCYIDTGVIHASAGPTVAYFGCLVRGRPTFQNGTVAFVDYDTLFSQSGNNGFRVRYGGVARIGSAAVFDAGSDAVLIEDGEARCDVFLSGADLLWGTGNGAHGIRVRSGGKVTYVTKPTVAGSVPGTNDTNVGNLVKTYAQIPFMNGYDGVTVGTGNGAMIVAFV